MVVDRTDRVRRSFFFQATHTHTGNKQTKRHIHDTKVLDHKSPHAPAASTTQHHVMRTGFMYALVRGFVGAIQFVCAVLIGSNHTHTPTRLWQMDCLSTYS